MHLDKNQVPDDVWIAMRKYLHEHPYGYDHRELAAVVINAWPNMSVDSLNPFGETKFVILPLEVK